MSDETPTTVEPAPKPWPRIVQLKHPIDFGSERITSLEFRRGKIADIKGIKLDKVMPTDSLITIAARLSNQAPKVIELLDVEDAGEVMGIALDFFAKCLSDGKPPSEL